MAKNINKINGNYSYYLLSNEQVPVSYTHLDVYKRQVVPYSSLSTFSNGSINCFKYFPFKIHTSKQVALYQYPCCTSVNQDRFYTGSIQQPSFCFTVQKLRFKVLHQPIVASISILIQHQIYQHSFTSVSYTHLDVYKRQHAWLHEIFYSTHTINLYLLSWVR